MQISAAGLCFSYLLLGIAFCFQVHPKNPDSCLNGGVDFIYKLMIPNTSVSHGQGIDQLKELTPIMVFIGILVCEITIKTKY